MKLQKNTLNHDEIGQHSERITKIKLFLNKYNWEGKTEKHDQRKVEKTNLTTGVNVFYAKNENIYPIYVSQHNSNRKNKLLF